MRKTMKKLTQGATRLFVLAIGLGLATTGLADFQKTNPVTGETESYTWKFVGTSDNIWNSNSNWQDSSGANPANNGIPAKTSGGDVWDPILFDGSGINITASMSVEGWNLRMGLYNGARVTMNNFVKYQGGTTMWMTVDDSSQLTVGDFGGGNIADNQIIKLSSAKAGGIAWNVDLATTANANANNTFEYYLKGSGSVSYQAVSAANHKIKQADITLSGAEKSVKSKTLVSFTSSTKTFTADATVKRFHASGADLGDATLTTVNTTGTTTLTTAGTAGDCELVQTETGILLYWVDGESMPTVGANDLEIPVSGDTNYSVDAAQTLSGVVYVTGSGTLTLEGTAKITAPTLYVAAGVTMNINSDRLDASKFTGSGTVVYTIGTDSSRVVASSIAAVQDPNGWTGVVELKNSYLSKIDFGYYGNANSTVRCNGVNGWLTWPNDYQTNQVASVKCLDIGEEGLTLVDKLSKKTFEFSAALTGAGTFSCGTGCDSDADRTSRYVFTGDASGFTGSISFGSRSTTDASAVVFSGGGAYPSASELSCGTICVANDATMSCIGTWTAPGGFIIDGTLKLASASKLNDVTALSGTGTIVLDNGMLPSSELKSLLSNTNWKGTFWLKNYSGSALGELVSCGNASSHLKLSNVSGYFNGAAYSLPMISVELDDGIDGGFGLSLNNGYGRDSAGRLIVLKKLIGKGTFVGYGSATGVTMLVKDWADFEGTLSLTNKVVVFGDSVPSTLLPALAADPYAGGSGGYVYICEGKTVTIPSGARWKTQNGYVVAGTLINNSADLIGNGTTLKINGTGTFQQSATWPTSETVTLAGSASLKFDPGSGNTYTMSSGLAAATENNKVLVNSGVLRPTVAGSGDGAFKNAEIDIENGGELLLDYTNDITGYNSHSAPIRIKTGGIMNIGKRETLAHNIYLEGGTLKISGSHSNRGLDLYSGRSTIYATANSTIEATGDYPVYIRDANATFDVAQGVTLTCNCAFTYNSSDSISDLVKTGAGTLVLNGYNSGAMTMPRGIDVQAGSVEANVNLTASGGGAFTLSSASATIVTGSGVTLSPTPTTTVANHHVKYDAGVYSVALDQFAVTIPSVANTTVSVSYTSGGVPQVATAAGDVSVDYGTDVTASWTAVSGYKITAGASQTLTAVASAQTLAPPTVEAKGATVSGVTFDYGDDFATATVTATVSGDATTYTLTVDGTDYPGAVNGATVTFENVVTGHDTAYDNVDYAITATDGTSSVVVSGGSGSAPVADVVNANWINENETTTGTSAGGVWTNAEAVTYTDGKATITDNRFEATTASTASRVVLEFNVCFSSTSDEDVSGEAQAAIKLGVVNSVTTFMVLTNGNEWAAVSAAELEPDASATYKVVLTIDYGSNAYGVTVGNYVLTNSAGIASFPLAASKTSVQTIDFAGSGTLTSMKGDQVEGYMVKDNAGHWYATIQAATQAYNSANGPYTVLHDGTAPDGWKIDEATKALTKLAKGFFFMAY